MGIKIEKKDDGSVEWTQLTLIHSILKDLKLEGGGFKNQPKVKTIPAGSRVVLTDQSDLKDQNPDDFDYRHVLKHLVNSALLFYEKSRKLKEKLNKETRVRFQFGYGILLRDVK